MVQRDMVHAGSVPDHRNRDGNGNGNPDASAPDLLGNAGADAMPQARQSQEVSPTGTSPSQAGSLAINHPGERFDWR
eukprot:13353448-Heterocapsa_arctica.AAC.1